MKIIYELKLTEDEIKGLQHLINELVKLGHSEELELVLPFKNLKKKVDEEINLNSG